jgi:hypothetical protein
MMKGLITKGMLWTWVLPTATQLQFVMQLTPDNDVSFNGPFGVVTAVHDDPSQVNTQVATVFTSGWDWPTALHVVELKQSTAFSSALPPGGVGSRGAVQDDPFQVSRSGRSFPPLLANPTATQKEVPAHETLKN